MVRKYIDSLPTDFRILRKTDKVCKAEGLREDWLPIGFPRPSAPRRTFPASVHSSAFTILWLYRIAHLLRLSQQTYAANGLHRTAACGLGRFKHLAEIDQRRPTLMRIRNQRGCLRCTHSKTGPSCWEFFWRENDTDGNRTRRTAVIGTVEQFPTRDLTQAAVAGSRMSINKNRNR